VKLRDFITLTYNDLACTDSVIIFDDCSSTDIAEKRRSQFTKAAQTGRHSGLSMIYITQQLTAVTKRFRQQVTIFVTFRATSKTLKELLEEAVIDLTNEQIKKLYLSLQEPYSNLYIDTVTNEKILTIPLKGIKKEFNEFTF
jgi:zona occludens toxin (predicted ATPase)